jgi:hypothetical protein
MTRPELQYWILFSMAVAGKGAKVTEEKMILFLHNLPNPGISGSQDGAIVHLRKEGTPFERVQYLISQGKLLYQMRKIKLGKYTLLNKGFRAALSLDLDNLDVEKLDAIPGIGPKSARMIMMYGFPDQKEYAVLDTHLLKWLKAHGHDVPAATPDGKVYERLEKIVLTEAKTRNMTARQFDTMVWQTYAKI